jgi:hypothetical protein
VERGERNRRKGREDGSERQEAYSNKSPTAMDKNSNPLYLLLPISSGLLPISTPLRK